jgi:hypothetical protein
VVWNREELQSRLAQTVLGGPANISKSPHSVSVHQVLPDGSFGPPVEITAQRLIQIGHGELHFDAGSGNGCGLIEARRE